MASATGLRIIGPWGKGRSRCKGKTKLRDQLNATPRTVMRKKQTDTVHRPAMKDEGFKEAEHA